MTKCDNCGTLLPEYAKYCGACGNKLSEEMTTTISKTEQMCKEPENDNIYDALNLDVHYLVYMMFKRFIEIQDDIKAHGMIRPINIKNIIDETKNILNIARQKCAFYEFAIITNPEIKTNTIYASYKRALDLFIDTLVNDIDLNIKLKEKAEGKIYNYSSYKKDQDTRNKKGEDAVVAIGDLLNIVIAAGLTETMNFFKDIDYNDNEKYPTSFTSDKFNEDIYKCTDNQKTVFNEPLDEQIETSMYTESAIIARQNNLTSVINPPVKEKTPTAVVVLSVVCFILVLISAFLGILFKTSIDMSLPYEAVAIEYLDNAAVMIEEDNTYYHRFGCPSFPSEYTYWIDTDRGAVQDGYSKCPDCYAESATDYVEYTYEY